MSNAIEEIKKLHSESLSASLDEIYKDMDSGEFCAEAWFGHGDDCFSRGMELGYQEAIERVLTILKVEVGVNKL